MKKHCILFCIGLMMIICVYGTSMKSRNELQCLARKNFHHLNPDATDEIFGFTDLRHLNPDVADEINEGNDELNRLFAEKGQYVTLESIDKRVAEILLFAE